MRFFVLFIILVVLFGCAFQSENEKYDVTLADAVQNESFDESNNISINTISVIMRNNEEFAVDCSIVLKLDNITNYSLSTGKVGVLQPDIQKRVSLHFLMFSGNTSLKITPECKKS